VRRGRALALLGLAAAALVVVPATAADAHPLGNFTINQYTGLHVRPGVVEIDLVTDMAEIPTFQVRGDIDANGDGRVEPTEATRWRRAQCAAQAAKLSLHVDGRGVAIRTTEGGALTFPPGQGGLATLRLECTLTAPVAQSTTHSLRYDNRNFAGRIGWREINAVAEDGARLVASDVPATSVSDRLTHYPSDLLRSPLAQRTASVRVALPAGAVATPHAPSRTAKPVADPTTILPRGVDRATRSFTELVARQHLTVVFGLAAVALAVLLGAIHALAPGHGKTVMAAYLVGQRGSLRQAVLIGLTVTVTHTAGVLSLGIVLTTSAVIAPERLYPWLGLASGLLLAAIGVSVLVRAQRGRRLFDLPQEHDYEHHDHEHVHHHGGHSHSHPPVDATMGWRSLVAMGFAGGLVPSPSALVVLLGAIALGRAWFGLVLVIAYGLGMAGTLTAAGLLLVRARALLDRRAKRSEGGLLIFTKLLPTATSMLIVVVGLVLAGRGLVKI